MPIVRKGHNFACGNCKQKIAEGGEYYTNEGDIFGYCFHCWGSQEENNKEKFVEKEE